MKVMLTIRYPFAAGSYMSQSTETEVDVRTNISVHNVVSNGERNNVKPT